MISRETRYHVSITELLKRNLMSHVAALFGRSRTILKVLFFSGHQQFFQKSLGINFLYDRVLAFLFIGGGRIIWDRGGIFRIIINRGGYQGAYHRGTWTGWFGGNCAQHMIVSLGEQLQEYHDTGVTLEEQYCCSYYWW